MLCWARQISQSTEVSKSTDNEACIRQLEKMKFVADRAPRSWFFFFLLIVWHRTVLSRSDRCLFYTLWPMGRRQRDGMKEDWCWYIVVPNRRDTVYALELRDSAKQQTNTWSISWKIEYAHNVAWGDVRSTCHVDRRSRHRKYGNRTNLLNLGTIEIL